MHQRRLVDIDHECGRVTADLGAVVHAKSAPSVGWVRVGILRSMDDLVDLGGGEAGKAFLLHAQYQRHHLFHSLTGFGGDVEDGDVRNEVQIVEYFFGVGIHGRAVFFNGIPFVYQNHA